MAGVRCRSGCVPSGYPQPPCPWPLSCEHSCRCHFSETNVSLLAYLFLVAFQLEAGLLQQFSGTNKRCGFVNSPRSQLFTNQKEAQRTPSRLSSASLWRPPQSSGKIAVQFPSSQPREPTEIPILDPRKSLLFSILLETPFLSLSLGASCLESNS